MIEITEQIFQREVVEVVDTYYVCNKCGARHRKMLRPAQEYEVREDGREYVPDDLSLDDDEACAFLHVERTGGWADRAFGDGVMVEFDLCQDCLLELVKSFVVPAMVCDPIFHTYHGEPHPFEDSSSDDAPYSDECDDWVLGDEDTSE